MKIKGIKYIAPFLDSSGYAQAARGNIMSLYRKGVPLTLKLMSFEDARPDLGNKTNVIYELIDKKIDYNVVIVHSTPEFWNIYVEPDKINVGYTIWETSKIHDSWVDFINNTVDKCLVGCAWNKQVFKDSGITIPLGVVPHGISMSEFENIEPYHVEGVGDDDFIFYSGMQWCYDDETRVLTKNGFKYFKDVDYSDELATLNKETDELEYNKPDKIVSFRRKDKMLSLNGVFFDLCVTPDHKMVVKEVGKDKSWQLKPLNELSFINNKGDLKVSGKYITKKNCIWKGGVEKDYFDLTKYSLSDYPIRKDKPTKIKMDDFLELFGWFISEGSVEKASNYYRVCITQIKNKKYKQEIMNCIKRAGFNPFLHNNKDILFNSREMYNYFCNFGKSCEKFIPIWIKNLSSRQINIFLNSLFKGDGNINDVGGFIKYTTTSKILAEDVLECLIKIGFSGSISISDPSTKKNGKIDGREIKSKLIQYTVSVNKYRNEPSMYYANLKEIDYDGVVYCATVKNHTMLVERKGKVVFSGNTERKHPVALLKAYWHAFPNNEKVALVLKTYRSNYSDEEKNAIRATVRRLKQVSPAKHYPKILFIPDMLTRDEILGLHKRGDCFVSVDRGEGFGLWGFEAGASGNPIIATGYGGIREYAKDENSYLIDYTLTPVFGMPWSPWYDLSQLWAEPNIKQASDFMRYVYNNREEAKIKGMRLYNYIKDNFSWNKIGNKIISEVEEVL